MEVKQVWTVCYSATGTTKKAVDMLGAALAEKLGVPLASIPFSTPADRAKTYVFAPTDVVIVGTPTYAGKMPNKLLPAFQTQLAGSGALAVAVVLFGNRSYDNALAELCATLEKDGFHTIGGAACVGQHAMVEKLAAGRPNEADMRFIAEFAERLGEAVRHGTSIPAPVQVPGDADAPYYIPKDENGQPAGFLKARPKTDMEKCVGCGACAEVCPMGSVSKENVSDVTGICIKCQACIKNCPAGAKYFDDPAFLSHTVMLERNFAEPKNNESFLACF